MNMIPIETQPSQAEEITRYQSLGYTVMKTKSRIGSTLLINWECQTVVKFSQDPAYDIFVDFAINSKAIYFPIF